MKIDERARSRGLTGVYANNEAPRVGAADLFAAQLDVANKRQGETEFDVFFSEVVREGEELVNNPSVEAVHKYRMALRRMLEHAVRGGLRHSSRTVAGAMGRRKVLMAVEEIDKELLALAEGLLAKQFEPMALLRMVGDIKGLLISLRL